MFGLAIPAAALVLGRLRAVAGGPFGGAIAATGVALVVIGGLALGLVWLRGDAARDVRVACDAERLAANLAAANQRASQIERALGLANTELQLRRDQQNKTETAMRERAAEAERLRDDIAKLEEAAGAARAVCLPDDGWLRRKRESAPATAARR